MSQLSEQIYDDVKRALAEDIGSGDLTASLISGSLEAEAVIICRESAILCGMPWFEEIFQQVDAHVLVQWHVLEGQRMLPNQPVVTIRGKARSLLTAERTAINFLQVLSGTATLTAQYVKELAGRHTRIVDSRKTIPGLRRAQKYAVSIGGGQNHRMGLFDAILIKENHIAAAGGVAIALRAAQVFAEAADFIQIEVESLQQLEEALDAGATMILLDNMSMLDMATAVKMTGQRAQLEISGGVSLVQVKQLADLGIDRISVGALTKHVRAVDFSMRFNQSNLSDTRSP